MFVHLCVMISMCWAATEGVSFATLHGEGQSEGVEQGRDSRFQRPADPALNCKFTGRITLAPSSVCERQKLRA